MTRRFVPRTHIAIDGDRFLINGQPTLAGRTWRGHRIEGLLPNARLVQGCFDDLNPDTVTRWAYPDTGRWDPERNVREFLAAMPVWRRHGLLAFTLNLQGGSPEGYSRSQPWENNAFAPDGSLRPAFLDRVSRIVEFADELGMVVILGYFYFGQDERLIDETAVLRAVDLATEWVLERGWRNVLIEVNNECDVRAYEHPILQPARVHELIRRVQQHTRDGHRLLASTSYTGGKVPGEAILRASDFVLFHGNGVHPPAEFTELVQRIRHAPGYAAKPLVCNEDDHVAFDLPENNFTAATAAYASWGFFDYRMPGEGYDAGYQNPPVNWGISSPRKAGFFRQLAAITGANPEVIDRP
jgi:hypothetical protein